MRVDRIGMVPRAPVIELEGIGEIAVAGVDFDQVAWPTYPTMEREACAYLREHVIPAHCDLKRSAAAMKDWIVAFDDGTYPLKDVSKLTRADGRKVAELVMGRGNGEATARKVMTLGSAALNHAKKEGRIDKVPRFWMPTPSPARQRVLTEEEQSKLMALPKSPRLHRFFVLAFATGARSRAIEELQWCQVDFTNRTIDYRTPGKNHKNKRRAVVFIGERLFGRLQAWHARRQDDYVIGLSPRGLVSSTYHDARKALAQIGIRERGVARHVTRHTVATRLLQQRVKIQEVAQLLGDTIAMVERVYGHVQPKDLAHVVNLLH